MCNMSKLTILTFLPLAVSGCFLYNVEYKGSNLNADHSLKTSDAAGCQRACKSDSRCGFWSWISPDYNDYAYRQDCYLKTANSYIENNQGVISGPKDCGSRKLFPIDQPSVRLRDFRKMFRASLNLS